MPDFDVVRETLSSIPGAPPDLASPPRGCRFHPRCPFVQTDCLEGAIPLRELGSERAARCLHHDQVALDVQREPVIANG